MDLLCYYNHHWWRQTPAGNASRSPAIWSDLPEKERRGWPLLFSIVSGGIKVLEEEFLRPLPIQSRLGNGLIASLSERNFPDECFSLRDYYYHNK